MDELVKALRAGEQADMDGTLVKVSRQACEEAADAIEALQARVAKKDAEIAAARDKALDDAARMVDCACECRDAVLAAKTKVDRWNACGRDPCGALDAADIRALKESPDA